MIHIVSSPASWYRDDHMVTIYDNEEHETLDWVEHALQVTIADK